ncbi:MAG: cytochrome c biogenesis protein CcdA [Flavobacterium sp.]|uniref:protein-disulfide reductase DsbD family protein n=1 Tax=Flavobacterium sp. TaxID=239 RepID=UPI0032660D1B
MKKIIALLLFFTFLSTQAQILDPVKWSSRVEKISETEFNLILDGKIDSGWHMYSQFTADGGPLPTILKFEKGAYELVGKTQESKTKTAFNEIFEVNETFFEKSVTLTQKIKVTNPGLKNVKVDLDYQVCKESCINANKSFQFEIPKSTIQTSKPEIVNETIDSSQTVTVKTNISKENTPIISPKNEEKSENNGIWSIFLLSILGGLFATITPCVFPMIPMTVSFFLKQSSSKSKGKFNAFFYGFCIVAICVLITIPFHLIEGINRDIFSEISNNVYLNIFFFLIFAIFAISFFGAFEITIPNKFANKVDNASNKGGLIGVFFMALTLIIVSFSCIGPAIGLVMGTSLNSDGGATILSIAMLGFGLGLALPFMFFALAPSLLSNLPKSGGWLNTVKVVFGFVELALAMKFISNADIGLDLHLIEREVFIAIWIALFATLSLYLFGKITLPHDSPLNHISVGRLVLAVITLSFTIYMIPGLWGAPLKIISAFPPPSTYSESPQGFGNNTVASSSTQLPKNAVYGVHNLVSFEDYEQGLSYAKEVNKPILIDFTGKQCQNCRVMENNVWSDEMVLKILKNDIVLISLYGDDRKELPENEQYISKQTGNKITTVGQKWSEFQRLNYGTNARPYYVLIGLDEKKLNEPVPYTPNIQEYKTWLEVGISKFKK